MISSALFLEFDPKGRLNKQGGTLWSSPHLRIDAGTMYPAPRLYRLEGRITVFCGHPIVGGRRDDRVVLEALKTAADVSAFARQLDGSFLVLLHDPTQATLTVVNDRFAGQPLCFWHKDDRFIAGTRFRQVLVRAREEGGGAIDPDNVLVFLWLRRLLGEGTLARDISYLRSASVLNVTENGIDADGYWQPDFTTPPPRRSALVNEVAEALRDAVTAHMSDDRRFGLLLSGGLDSRALLAAAPSPPVCLTTGLNFNNEVAVAAEVAQSAGAPHHFLPRALGLFDGRLDEASDLAGMQIYSEAQFLGYGPHIEPLADVIMMGLGLDVFFGGLYLPKVPATLMGRDALHYRLLPLPSDLAGFYVDKVKYRLKTSDPIAVVEPPLRATVRDRVRAQVEDIMARGRALGAEGYALWEYMHVHNFSRHYSFPMMDSVRTFAECRAPGLNNRLFGLALAMDAHDKLDGTAYQRAIAKLAPTVMRVRNANTNFPAGWPLRRQTWAKASRFALSRVGLGHAVRSPGWQDRSWPLPRTQLEASARLMNTMRTLPDCPVLQSTGVIDPEGVQTLVHQHETGAHDHTVLLNLLLTLSSVLRPADGR